MFDRKLRVSHWKKYKFHDQKILKIVILDQKWTQLTQFDPNIIFDSNLDLDTFSRDFVTFVTSIRNQTCH